MHPVCCACTLLIEGSATSTCYAARLGDCANVKQLAERLEWLGKQTLCRVRNGAAFVAKLFAHGLLSKELLLGLIDALLDKAWPALPRTTTLAPDLSLTAPACDSPAPAMLQLAWRLSMPPC